MNETVWHMKEQVGFCRERVAWKKAPYFKRGPKKQTRKFGRFSLVCQ